MSRDENDDKAETSFHRRGFGSLKSLPFPGREPDDADDLSHGVSNDGSNNSVADDPLVCRESLPLLPPVDESDKIDPLICHENLPSPSAELLGSDGEFDASTVDSTSDIELHQFAVNTAATVGPGLATNNGVQSGIEVGDSSQIHLELQPSGLDSLSDSKLSGVPAEKLEQSRKRVPGQRPLPSASLLSRQKKSRVEENSEAGRQQPKFEGVSDLLNSSSQLAYSWDSLGLGEELGSAALNRCMSRLRELSGGTPGTVEGLTAQETLQIMSSLRVRTLLPPPKSDLHTVIRRNRFENREALYGSLSSEWMHEKPRPRTPPGNEVCRIPLKSLARLYEIMCAQDADDGMSNRREAQYLSADATIKRLHSLENKACDLKLNESEVLKRGRELGLLNPIHRSIPEYFEIRPGGQN